MSLRAAIYARVSSATQREAHTIENQLRVLPAFVAAQGWTLVGTYIDDGKSARTGKLDKRDGLARLLADAQRGVFDRVVVVDIDRLTRSDDMRERAQILGAFQAAGVPIVTTNGTELDLRSMFGELYVTMQAIVAAEENRKRVARTRAGKERGVLTGRKPQGMSPYGLVYDRESGAWAINADEAAVVREIVERILGGDSCRQIADDLRERGVPGLRTTWHRSAVWRIATSRHIAGTWRLKIAAVPVPAIIDAETYARVQDVLSDHKPTRGVRKSKHVYLLEGLGVCGKCGAPMQIRTGQINRHDGYFRSAGYICRDRRGQERREATCDAPILPVEATDAAAWSIVYEALTTGVLVETIKQRYAMRAENRRDFAADVAKYEARLVKAEQASAKIAERFRRGLLSETAFDLELAAAAKERRTIEAQLEVARDAVRAHEAPRESMDVLLDELRALAETEHAEDRQRAVRLVVPRARFIGDEIDLGLAMPERRVEHPSQARRTLGQIGDVRIRVVAPRMRLGGRR